MTVEAGAGNDTISVSGKKNLIVYNLDDGNDIIYGFDGNDTLQIDDGTGGYVTKKKGDDMIVQIGGGYVTLKGAASLKNVHIAGTLTDQTTESERGVAVGLVNMSLKRTVLNYPVLAAIAFNPNASFGSEPTNYSDKETWSISSNDGLKLNGVYYAPEKSDDKWVVLIHGYGMKHQHMYPFASFYLENGYNVLMVDQRAAGESEGTWLTMGAAEAEDIALWTQEIARRYPKSKITLHGVSMGAATAMLAASRSDIKNVTSLVEDCGYSDVMEIVRTLGKNIPLFGSMLSDEVITLMDSSVKTLTDYNLSAAAPIDFIGSAKVPSLFITGTADSVVSPSMLDELYDASGASVKEKFIVEGAGHAAAGLLDPVGYANSVFRFVAEADGEGWKNINVVDEILLKGTKYGDNFTNSGAQVSIVGGKGNDTIKNIAANVVFDYNTGDGKDIIYGFNKTSTLNVTGGSCSTKTSGKNLIVTVDKGKITLVGAASLKNVNIDFKKLLTVTDKTSSPVKVDSDVKIIDASTRTKAVKITGNKLANSIVGGSAKDIIYGGKGNDSIYGNAGNDKLFGQAGNDKIFGGAGNDCIKGGTGNDSLWGDDGADKFFYEAGDGKDIIFGFDDKDTLTLDGLDFTTYFTGSYNNPEYMITLNVSGGSISFKDFTATTFHIDNDTYKISGSKFKKITGN